MRVKEKHVLRRCATNRTSTLQHRTGEESAIQDTRYRGTGVEVRLIVNCELYIFQERAKGTRHSLPLGNPNYLRKRGGRAGSRSRSTARGGLRKSKFSKKDSHQRLLCMIRQQPHAADCFYCSISKSKQAEGRKCLVVDWKTKKKPWRQTTDPTNILKLNLFWECFWL